MEGVNRERETNFDLLFFVCIEAVTIRTGKMGNWSRSHILLQ